MNKISNFNLSKNEIMKIGRPLFLFFLLQFSSIVSFSITSDCDIVKYVSRCQVKDGKLIQIDTIVFQINNRVGEKYSGLAIPYSKLVKISDIEGWVIDANGKKVRSLKSSDIQERSHETASAMYTDSYEKVFDLKHSIYPYKIYYTYKLIKSQFITIADWSPVLYKSVSTLDAKLYVTVPKNYPIKKYFRNATFVYDDSTDKDCVNYRFSSNYEKVKLNEQFAEPFENIMPKVVITPINFFYGVKGGANSWVDYGNWFLDLNRDLLVLPESERLIVDDLLKGVSEPKTKAKILYYYLQDHTRYINISIGVGGYKSFPASYVCQNKYGDCKALTNYMMALLKYAGIKSYYTLINSSFQPEKVIEEIPCPQFNHIILCVPFDKDTLWLENTSTIDPFGYVGSSIQNREALFIDQNKSRLIKIPIIDTNQFTVSRKIVLKVNQKGDGDCRAYFTFKGYYYSQYNQLNTFYNKKEQEQIVNELMPFQSYDLIEWELQKYNRDSAKIRLDSRLNLYKFFKPLGDDSYFSLNPILRYSFERPTERIQPLQIPFPINNIDTTIYEIPDGYFLKKVPEDVRIETRYGKSQLSTIEMGNKICVVKKLLIYSNSLDLLAYKDFFDFIKAVKEIDKRVIVLKNKNNN